MPTFLVKSGYVRQDSVEEFLQMYRAMEAGAKTVSGEFWFRTPEGTDWWCEHIDYTNVFDATGRPVRAYAVGRNVTDKKLAEIRYNEELSYRTATMSNTLMGSIRADLTTGEVEEIDSDNPEIQSAGQNQSYDACVHLLSNLLINDQQQEEFLTMALTPSLLDSLKKGESQKSHTGQRKMADGTYRWAKTTIKLFPKPNSNHTVAFLYTDDINDKVLLDQVVQQIANINYDIMGQIDAIHDRYTLFAYDHSKIYLDPNEISYEGAIAAYLSKLMTPEQQKEIMAQILLSVVLRELETKTQYTVKCTITEENGTTVSKLLCYSYLDRQTKTLLFTQNDVTEIVKNEQQHQMVLHDALQAAEQASRAKTEFLSRMSHEIRTPMNAIIGMSALAAQAVDDPQEVAEYLSKVEISAHFLLSLINDILDMSRIESGKVSVRDEAIPFESFLSGVNTIADAQAQAKGVHYAVKILDTLHQAYRGDAMKLQQVLINILGNAIKFTPKGGQVQLIIHEELRRKDHANLIFRIKDNGIGISDAFNILGNAIKFTPKGGQVQLIIHEELRRKDHANLIFRIKDNGIGISDAFQKHIFEAFSQENVGPTTTYGGTGLGLAICKNLVDLMGGTIQVKSTEGIGTVFTVAIPLGIIKDGVKNKQGECLTHHDTPPNHLDHSGPTPPQSLRHKRVLLVEDHPLNTEVAKRLLLSQQINVDVAENGRLGVEKFAAAPAGYYDAILMDIRMPVMDGLIATKTIRQMDRPDAQTVPIIAMTANAFDEDVQRTKAAGMNAHLAKPIEPALLLSTLCRYVCS